MKLINIKLFFFAIVVLSACGTAKDYPMVQLDIPDSYRDRENVPDDPAVWPYKPVDFFMNGLLQELLDTAFVQNSDLQIAIKNIELAESSMRTVKLNYLPDISAQINGNYTHASRNGTVGTLGGSRVSENYTLSLGLNWDVDLWGKIRREKQEAWAGYLQTEEVRKTVQMKLTADVAKSYYNLLMLDRQLEIARESRSLSDSTLQMLEIQYKVGDANNLGIQQMKAQIEQNNLLLSQIEQSIASQENALSLLCGDYAKAITRKFEPGNEFTLVPQEGLPMSILANRPDVKSVEYALLAANARVGIRRIAMYPSLNINASGGLNSLTASNWFTIPASLFGTVAGGLTQPIFNKRKLKEQYEQAKIEREKAVITFRQSVLSAYSQVSDALRNKEEIEKQYVYSKNREEALKEGIRSSTILFRAGNINYLEVISVQMNYLQAQLETANLYISRINSNIELYYALGGGWK